ncbi:ficolin-1-like [Physella acuta]|uniref:ficolin-1-like n=1 Tax=Physella acuta TaxID=109671 RepID=UPI0027DDC88D|nr:ficolin-1-like [Physella acuta]
MGLYCLILFVLAILLFSQQFNCSNTENYAEKRSFPTGIYDAPRCSTPYCLTSHGNSRPGCERNTMGACYKKYEVFESLGGKRVLCDTKTDGGGWIVIQRRINGIENFNRNWANYSVGFGSLDGDFWMGNDFISQLTYSGYTELRIDMGYKGKSYYAEYENLLVKDEAAKYQISFNFKKGNVEDEFTFHVNMFFSTHDRDNDIWPQNCAYYRHGGYWFKWCTRSNLNGKWQLKNVFHEGVTWISLTGTHDSLDFTEMKVRRP